MAKARAVRQRETDALRQDLIAIGLAAAGALVLVSLIYAGKAIGPVPAKASIALRTAVGLGAYAVPVWLFVIAAFYGFETRPVTGRRVWGGATLLVLALLVLLQLRLTADWRGLFDAPHAILDGGGYLGASLAWLLLRLLGPPGAYIVIVAMAFAGTVLLTKSTARDLLAHVGNAVLGGASTARGGVQKAVAHTNASRRARNRRRPRQRRVTPLPGPNVDLEESPQAAKTEGDPQQQEPGPQAGDETDAQSKAKPRRSKRRATKRGAATKEGAGQPALLKASDLFALPSLSMLTDFPHEVESAAMRDEAAEQIIKLEDTLASFGISAKVTHYERGPVLTRYEVEPERGIRVNQVVRLADDLAMALAAVDVRVEAPIPGKSAIGIEVPNETRGTVSLVALLQNDEYQNHPSKLAFPLGRDIAGEPVVVDIEAMPHLLIAGATGSGKSVCLHATIVSLLMRSTPEQVRFIMVDPKRVELAVYDGIPHLMAPVVHSVKQAADVLRKAIREMEKRYDKFALKGVVNLAEYNALSTMPKEHAIDEFEPLPRVVIIIDELADLMMQAKAEFEFSICRIAQLARATGIHLILATQRPSVKVVTGNIKANIPSRIALAVASLHDSRTIIDGQGADRLIGRGDMLYAPIDASKPRRIQGAFVPRDDIERVTEHLRQQGEPDFDIIPEVPEDDDDFASELDTSDEFYAAAVQYVVQEQEASVSMIQRRFKVGYARAGRLIDVMEQRGVVGPHEGSKPRQVFIGAHAVDALLQGKNPARDEQDDTPPHALAGAAVSHAGGMPPDPAERMPSESVEHAGSE